MGSQREFQTQTKTKTMLIEYIKSIPQALKTILLDDGDVSDLSEIDNWENFHPETQEEMELVANIHSVESKMGVAKKKLNQFAKATDSLEKQRKNPNGRQKNMKFKKVDENEILDNEK